MNRLRRILAWITLVLIGGMVIATFILGIIGSTYTISMLGVTMGISILLWALLWFMKVLEDKNNKS
jgi:hypothetical protein